jgi:hypothetical protein
MNDEKKLDSNSSLYLQFSQEESQNDTYNSQIKCFNCGWSVSANADICENCNEWLLSGKCNFCYADYEENQKFCSECGNPPSGIICGSCGILSHFDFCPNCQSALTENSRELINEIFQSAEIQNILNLEIDESKQKATDINDTVSKLKDYLSRFESKSKVKKSFTLETDNNIEQNMKVTNDAAEFINLEKRKAVENEEKEKETLRLLQEMKSKKFANNQDARRYFGALKIILPQLITKRREAGWTCNAFGVTHSAPQDCADPLSGGTWIYETIIEKSTKEIEI